MADLYYRSAGTRYQHRYQIVDQAGTTSRDFVLQVGALTDYTFRRRPGELGAATAKALAQLRQQHNKLRLFYSGGLDSHFVLHHCLINNIHLDEIYSAVKTPYQDPVLLALDESVNSAQPYLRQNADRLSQTKIHTPTLDHAFFDQFYSSPDYWRYSYLMYMGEPSRVCNMIQGFGLDTNEFCNLVGIDTPYVYWHDGWRFCFVDHQMLSEHVNKQTSNAVYSLSLDNPEFLEAYVNTIVDQLERYSDYRTRFSLAQVLASRSKSIQQLIPDMQAVNGLTWGLRLPKSSGIPAPSGISFMEKTVYANFRSFIHWQQAKLESPEWFDRWVNYTNWTWVEKCNDFGGVFSDHYILND